MPSTIPYDPSMVIANVVHPDRMDLLEQIAAKQAPVDAAQDALNDAQLALRSLSMTIDEVANLGVDTADLVKGREPAQKAVKDAAEGLMKARLAALKEIQELRNKIRSINAEIESPVDYTKTEIKQMPIAANSITLDSQYFSFDENVQDSDTTMSQIRSFVSAAFKDFTYSGSAQATAAVTQQINTQREHHDIEGTLVITCRCTHRMADVLAPFAIDVDKAIRVWNMANKGQAAIPVHDPAGMQKLVSANEDASTKGLTILSGVTYGSSFVGMVHVLRSSDTQTSQRMLSAASQLQAQAKVGRWLQSVQGGFGMDQSFTSDLKSLLSTQRISSHVSMVTMGAIPSIKSNELQIAVKQFSNFSPDELAGNLAKLQQSQATDTESVQSSAEAARTGQAMVSLKAGQIQAVLAGVSETDDGKNKILDVNSLMDAFEDYVNKVAEGNCGVPINFYLKKITASQLAQMWVSKYLPNQFLMSAGDDVNPTNNPTATGGTNP